MRRLAWLALMGLLLASCTAAGTDEGFVLGLLDDVETQPHEFEYREVFEGGELVVRGTVEDDFRRSAKLSVDGRELLEQVVSDDGLAVRVLDAEALGDLSGLEDPEAAAALRRGDWVIDHVGAPDLFPPATREGSVEIGLGPLLDSAYILSYLRRAVQEGADVEEHNPDDPEYQPLDDAFVVRTEQELSRSQGYRRFDVLLPSLPSPAEGGGDPPGARHFRKVSFFLRGDRIVKVMEEISFERREFRRAQEGRAPQFYLELLESVRQGGTSEPVRLRSMEYSVLQLGRRIEVEVPLEEAVAGSLNGLERILAFQEEDGP